MTPDTKATPPTTAPGNSSSDIAAALAAGAGIAAKPITNPNEDSGATMVVPEGWNRLDFPRAQQPFRKKGTIALDDAASFVQYWNRFKTEESLLYGSLSPAQFVAVFNENQAPGDKAPALAGWRDYRATYVMQHSREWAEWMGRNKQKFEGNEAFAIWLENNLHDMLRPDGAEMMEIALNFRVNSTAAFSNPVRLPDGNTEFTYSNNIEGSSQTRGGKVTIPEQFRILVPVWQGIGAKKYEVDARFRYRLHGPTLSIWFDLVRPHKVIEEAFNDLLLEIEEGAKTKVLFGKP